MNEFCTEDEYERFMDEVNHFEHMITRDGVMLIKFYFSIDKKEQKKRFDEIKNNPLKRWKMTPVDENAQRLWSKYTEYKKRMFAHTDTVDDPWKIIEANRKTSARIEAIEHVLEQIPYS